MWCRVVNGCVIYVVLQLLYWKKTVKCTFFQAVLKEQAVFLLFRYFVCFRHLVVNTIVYPFYFLYCIVNLAGTCSFLVRWHVGHRAPGSHPILRETQQGGRHLRHSQAAEDYQLTEMRIQRNAERKTCRKIGGKRRSIASHPHCGAMEAEGTRAPASQQQGPHCKTSSMSPPSPAVTSIK